jgi:hypothetical protein
MLGRQVHYHLSYAPGSLTSQSNRGNRFTKRQLQPRIMFTSIFSINFDFFPFIFHFLFVPTSRK